MFNFAEIFTWQAIGTALLIFVVRMVSITFDTLRFMLTMRGKKVLAWIFGFFDSVLFVLTVGAVLNDLSNPLYIIAYAAGFSTGTVVGMAIEQKLAMGFSHISIVTKTLGDSVTKALRDQDFAVTAIPAVGRDGPVQMSSLTVRRKDVAKIEKIVLESDPDAFITIEDVTPLRSGYWGRTHGRS